MKSISLLLAMLFLLTGLGIWLSIPWMTAAGGAYLSLLWFPFTPEKVITVLIALFLLKRIFPHDTRTLLVLKQELDRAKASIRRRKDDRVKKKRNENACTAKNLYRHWFL